MRRREGGGFDGYDLTLTREGGGFDGYKGGDPPRQNFDSKKSVF